MLLTAEETQSQAAPGAELKIIHPYHGTAARLARLDLLRHINMLGLFSAETSIQDKTH